MLERRLLVGFLALASVVWGGTGSAVAGGDHVTLNLRGGGLARADDDLADATDDFGLAGAAMGGGGILEAGVRLLPRLWLYGSWSSFSGRPEQPADLTLTTRCALGHLRYRLYRADQRLRGQPLTTVVEGSLGGGRYWLDERLGGERRGASGWGGRAGLTLTLYWRAIGYTLGYAYHLTDVTLGDGLGGRIGAGGHEFGGGLSLRF